MKKAIVFVKDHTNHKTGDVLRIDEAAQIDAFKGHFTSDGFAKKIEVPAELEEIPANHLKAVKVASQPERWTQEGQEDVFQEPADPENWTYVPAVPEHWELQRSASYVEYDKKKRIGDKFQLLNKQVEDEMKQVYQTSNPDSAVANYLTWLAMKNTPAKFAGKGLVVRFEVIGFTIGEALDTEQKVQDYATTLIAQADDYAVYREQKILNFVAEKGQIEAE